jgi:eukaryotic-like serine/threonine-protein kinase
MAGNGDMEEILHERYTILRQLGKKSGRRTLLVSDNETGKSAMGKAPPLAIAKLLTFSSDFAWEDLKLFEREAETLKTLDHPAIPSYIDYFELTSGNKGYALVQTYVDGKSLEEYIQSGRIFTEKELKNIAKQLLEILIYLHSQYPPVIHRDIKPSNIILVEKTKQLGKIYLVDFGSVQTLASKAGKTVTVVGTYGYMPPEQFGGYATPASDLYSLGATLIALATGIHPADLPQQGMQIAFSSLVNFSPAFTDWLEWLTEADTEKRLQTAAIALEALEIEEIRNDGSSILTRRVNPYLILWDAVIRSTFIGGLSVTGFAALYSTVVIPAAGTIIGGMIGAMIGFPLGLANGILVWFITQFCFSPLKNAHLHRRVISISSFLFGTAVSLVYFSSIGLSAIGSQNTSFPMLMFWIVSPSIITGLSMGIASQKISKWYERESRVRLSENSRQTENQRMYRHKINLQERLQEISLYDWELRMKNDKNNK